MPDRSRTQAATQAPAGWYLYRFDTDLRCAIAGCQAGHPLYQGKSNEPLRRLLEHAKTQPWWPYVTGWSIDPGVYVSDADVLAAERAAIAAELPLANRQHNEGNAHRLDFGSVAPRPVARRPRRTSAPPRRRPARRRWSRPARRLAWRTAVWLVLAVVIFVAEPSRVPFGTAVESSVLGASVLLAAPLLGRRRRRRRW